MDYCDCNPYLYFRLISVRVIHVHHQRFVIIMVATINVYVLLIIVVFIVILQINVIPHHVIIMVLAGMIHLMNSSVPVLQDLQEHYVKVKKHSFPPVS